MTLPKFIITMDGFFRLGMVNQHKDLLKPGDSCLGGGYYHFDYTSNRIILDRSSYDFGKPKWHLLEVLKKATSGTLALLGDGGYPYAVPISYVYDDGKLYFHSAMSGHKVDAIRSCDKASFCVIDQDCVRPAEYTTYFRSVIAFGRISIVEDEEGARDVDNIGGGHQEKLAIARNLGNRYNPNQEEALQKELEHGLARMLAIRLDIEHLTGKEAIELVRRHQK